MQIPWQALSDDALLGIVQEFVLREGTDYGHSELSLETKVREVVVQIKDGRVGVFFDAATATTTLQQLT